MVSNLSDKVNSEFTKTESHSRILDLLREYFSKPTISREIIKIKLDEAGYSLKGSEILEIIEQISGEREFIESDSKYRQERIDQAEKLLNEILEKIENKEEFSELYTKIDDYLA